MELCKQQQQSQFSSFHLLWTWMLINEQLSFAREHPTAANCNAIVALQLLFGLLGETPIKMKLATTRQPPRM